MQFWKSSNGFTLSELLVAAGIMAYALSVILTTFVSNYALNETSRNLTIAASHMNYVLEDIRNTTFSSVATNITNGDWNWDTSEIASEGLSPLNNESITVASSGSTLLTITVTASWRDLQQRSQSKSIQTQMGGSQNAGRSCS